MLSDYETRYILSGDLVMPRTTWGKWYVSRNSGASDLVKMDFDVSGHGIVTEMVDVPIYLYLHKDGKWQRDCEYFDSQAKLQSALNRASGKLIKRRGLHLHRHRHNNFQHQRIQLARR